MDNGLHNMISALIQRSLTSVPLMAQCCWSLIAIFIPSHVIVVSPSRKQKCHTSRSGAEVLRINRRYGGTGHHSRTGIECNAIETSTPPLFYCTSHGHVAYQHLASDSPAENTRSGRTWTWASYSFPFLLHLPAFAMEPS